MIISFEFDNASLVKGNTFNLVIYLAHEQLFRHLCRNNKMYLHFNNMHLELTSFIVECAMKSSINLCHRRFAKNQASLLDTETHSFSLQEYHKCSISWNNVGPARNTRWCCTLLKCRITPICNCPSISFWIVLQE